MEEEDKKETQPQQQQQPMSWLDIAKKAKPLAAPKPVQAQTTARVVNPKEDIVTKEQVEVAEEAESCCKKGKEQEVASSDGCVEVPEGKVGKLVVDTGGLVKGVDLHTLAVEVYTTPRVLEEVRDKHTRNWVQFLQTLPYEIKELRPTKEDFNAVVDFAKKTGDYTSLSSVDLEVLALTYMLEREEVGVDHLRKDPLSWKVIEQKTREQRLEKLKNANEKRELDQDSTTQQRKTQPQQQQRQPQPPSKPGEKLSRTQRRNRKRRELALQKEKEEAEKEAANNAWGGWISPENVKQLEDKLKTKPDNIRVGCLTLDYAMQNVLLQFGLHLLSVDGLQIKVLKTYLQRCHACCKVTGDMEKLFCPSCGNHSLEKVSYTIDDNGNIQLFTKKRKPNIRGTKYSIPLRKGGRKNQDIVLREDELPYGKRRKKEVDIFDPDHDFLAPRKGVRKDVVVGYGNKNPNKSRRRTGKRKKKAGTLN